MDSRGPAKPPKIGSSVGVSRLPEGQHLEGCTTVAKSCSNHPEPTRCDLVMVERTVQRQALSRPVGTCFATRRSGVQIPWLHQENKTSQDHGYVIYS